MNEHADPVTSLVDDARAVVTRACAAVPPDFAAVLARAQHMATDEARADFAASLAEAQRAVADDGESDVVDIRTHARESERSGVHALVVDARAAVERMVEQQRMRAIPPMPMVRPRRRVGLVVGAVGLLAAAAVVAFSSAGWVERMGTNEGDATRDQAFDLESTVPDGGEIVEEVVPPPRPTPAPRVPVPTIEAPAVAPIATPQPPRAAGKPRVDADRLRTLSDEARALWRAGDRRGAEAKFLQVTSAGGRSALAELAWGDLFALARQLGDDGRLAKRWRSYLAKFPRGRYADDARAGLCRTAANAGRCWADYLRDFPNGSYRTEARRGATEGK